MSEHSAEKDTPYKIVRHGGLIIAVCVCGSERSVVDKGLGWAHIAAWKTQHHSCGETRLRHTARSERLMSDADLSTVTDRYDVGTVANDGTAHPWSLDCEYPYTTLKVVVCKRCGAVVSRLHIPEHDVFHDGSA